MDRRACWLGCMALWAARRTVWAQARPRLIAVLNVAHDAKVTLPAVERRLQLLADLVPPPRRFAGPRADDPATCAHQRRRGDRVIGRRALTLGVAVCPPAALARAVGRSIPQSLLPCADKVIE